jgi:hypothetical protein
LKFATLSVIESLRTNPEEYKFVSNDISNNNTISYGLNYLSLMLSEGQQHQQQSFNDRYIAFILEEAEKLFNKLTIELTTRAITAAAAISTSSSLPLHNNRQKQN